jgi:hypothetical protein
VKATAKPTTICSLKNCFTSFANLLRKIFRIGNLGFRLKLYACHRKGKAPAGRQIERGTHSWWKVLVGVVVLNLLWSTVRTQVISLQMAILGMLLVRLKWVTIPVSAFLLRDRICGLAVY